MKAELIIKSGKCELDDLFGDEGSISHTVDLHVNGDCISRITHTNIEALYEILNIEETTEEFIVDTGRLNYIQNNKL
jgi:hypothetical protein